MTNANYDKIVIFTGAGLSAESGISTFRDANGLWENNKIEDVCTFSTWKKNYDLVHRFYNDRREQLATVQPNHAHLKIKEWCDRYPNVTNITQNVDDLLERAGCTGVVHLHGKIRNISCQSCGNKIDIGYTRFDTSNPPMLCTCGNFEAKPDVVFFGENAPEYATYGQTMDAIDKKTVVIIIGTSGQVVPIQYDLIYKSSFNILNNLEFSDIMDRYSIFKNGSIYDAQFYEPATTGVDKIDAILKTLMGY